MRFAFSFLKVQESAEEVAADVLLKLWTMKEALLEVHSIKTYLYTATKNAAINYLEKNKKYTTWDLENIDVELTPGTGNPEAVLLNDELRTVICDAIMTLPPKCRLVYKLIREDGLTYKEVADILDISVHTVDSHLTKALHKLIAVLKLYIP
jgi:RNA polymerase sigma-70 factor (ECF subfamily)